MLRSEAERVVRRALEDTGAEFTEEQIQALSLLVSRIATTTVEEALSQWRPTGGGGGGFR